MKEPLVSILIPTYNRDDMVVYAVESALAQTYRNTEVIVYDDGSDDATEEMIDQRCDANRIRYVRADENHGVGYSRARLLELAEGEYGCWLDADDLCNKWRVQLQVSIMRTLKPSFIRTARTFFGLKQRVEASAWRQRPVRSDRDSRQCLVSPSLMFRMDNARRVPYEESLRCGSDVVWELEMTLNFGTGVYIPLALYHYGRGDDFRVTRRAEAGAKEFQPSRRRKDSLVAVILAQLLEAGIERWPCTIPPGLTAELQELCK